MPIESTAVSVNFGQGIDTKTDPKLVVPGKLIDLKDGVFTKAKRVAKRNGYDSKSLNIIGGGTISNPKMVKAYGQKLVAAASGNLYDFSTSLNAWKNAGTYESISVEDTFISGSNEDERAPTTAIGGNYAVIAYDAYTNINGDPSTNNIVVGVSVLDLSTNTFLLSDFKIQSGSGFTYNSKSILLGSSTLAVMYFSGNGLCIRILTISSGSVAVGTEIVLATDIQSYTKVSYYPWVSYDVANNSSGAVIAYSSDAAGNPIKYIQINTSGSSTATGTLASAGYAIPLSITLDASNRVWTFWGTPSTNYLTTNTTLNYAIRDSALTSVLGKTSIDTGLSFVRQVTSFATSANAMQVYYSTGTLQASGPQDVSLYYPVIHMANVTSTATVGSSSVFFNNLDIYSKPFVMNGNTYMSTMFYSPTQMTGFLMKLDTTTGVGVVSAKFLSGNAEGAYGTEVNSDASRGGYWWRQPGNLSVVQTYGTKSLMAAGKIIEADLIGYSTSITTVSEFVAGSILVNFDYTHKDAYQSFNVNDTLVLNGGIVSLYDGATVTELGFNNYPEVNAVKANSGGSLDDGTYGYQAVYQWVDAIGNVYQSAPSVLLSFAVAGGSPDTSTVTLSIKTQCFSKKDAVPFASQITTQIYIYRTLKNGIIPYLIGKVTNVPSATSVTFLDDGSIDPNEAQPIYTAAGAVVENTAVPPALLMWTNNNRLWLVDSENPETNIWYSKTVSPGTGVAFSDLLIYTADSKFGKIVWGQGMDEKTILCKERGFLYFIGDGANDAGNGATFSNTQVVPSDVGGVSSKSVVLMPQGLLFKSPKGIYIFGRGANIQYFGYEVEQYNSQTITAAEILSDVNQIRFLTSSGYSLVYDYFFNQWGVFTNHEGLSSTIWNGTYVYARTGGLIYQENPSSFLDNASSYYLEATTSWIKAASIQNFQRARLLELLGDYSGSSSHGAIISVAYDFISTFIDTNSYLFDGLSSVYQYQAFMPIQKCDSFQVRIREVVSGASGEYIDFSDLGVEIGVKKGLNKLPASKSVG